LFYLVILKYWNFVIWNCHLYCILNKFCEIGYFVRFSFYTNTYLSTWFIFIAETFNAAVYTTDTLFSHCKAVSVVYTKIHIAISCSQHQLAKLQFNATCPEFDGRCADPAYFCSRAACSLVGQSIVKSNLFINSMVKENITLHNILFVCLTHIIPKHAT